MCGIAGFTFAPGQPAEARHAEHAPALRRMVASLRHRGPDAQRALVDDGCALGHARLAIVDLSGGQQPMRDPHTGVAITFNGEVFNFLELREELAGRYAFRTRSDTEVLLAAYLTWGIDCLRRLVGQYAFALWDPRDRSVWLARDHVGIAPLFYALTPEGLVFASEGKAILASGKVAPALDAQALAQTLSLWTPVSPRSTFENISALPPGCWAHYANGKLHVQRYWDLDLDPSRIQERSLPTAVDQLGALLESAVKLRLRADVPVAAYLSGGLDSSLLCALANEQLHGALHTYSVGFSEARFDERSYQAEVVRALGTKHRSVEISDREIGELIPRVVEHAEQLLMRSAPAPFLRLSTLVRATDTRVVLTGEGADEHFLGYDLFKETLVRSFWSRAPESLVRPALLRRLYPSLPLAQQPAGALREFFGRYLDARDPAFSHRLRWTNGGRIGRFFAPEFTARVAGADPIAAELATLPDAFAAWPPLQRAQYLEIRTLLSGYLLSAQGDRMLLANGVEGRFPFLDHRVMEFAARLPTRFKLQGLHEKVILKRYARGRVPEVVLQRHKFPYRAPIAGALAGPQAASWTEEAFSPEAVGRAGIFDPEKVRRLRAKVGAAPLGASEADTMALMAVATAQLLHAIFTRSLNLPSAHLERVEVLQA